MTWSYAQDIDGATVQDDASLAFGTDYGTVKICVSECGLSTKYAFDNSAYGVGSDNGYGGGSGTGTTMQYGSNISSYNNIQYHAPADLLPFGMTFKAGTTPGGAGGSATDKFTPPFSLEVLKNDFTSFSTPVSIDIDGNSYKAVKLSGELQIESSSAITTSNDGGTTTVTGAQNSFTDGFYNITSSSTGEIKTIKPLVLDGDFSAGHPDGLTASSAVISYGLSIPATGTGTAFSGTLDISELDSLSTSEVAKELAKNLRSNSPSIEILGSSLANVPEDGSSFRINHDGLAYTLTMENGEVIVSGGEKDLLTAYFENADPITVNTTSLNGAQTITSTEHGLETGDAVTYNAAEKVTVAVSYTHLTLPTKA